MWDEQWAQRGLDAASAITPSLNVVEGVIGRDGSGFDVGRDELCNVVIAGLSSPEVDAVGTWIMGHDPREMPYLRIAKERGVPVRSPLTASMKYPRLFPDAGAVKKGKALAAQVAGRSLVAAMGLLPYATLGSMEKRVARLDDLGIPHPAILIDYLSGNPTPFTAMHILRNLPEGVSEIVVHLGTSRRSGPYPTGLDVENFPTREQELAIVTSESLREYAKGLNIRAVGFQDLASLVGGE